MLVPGAATPAAVTVGDLALHRPHPVRVALRIDAGPAADDAAADPGLGAVIHDGLSCLASRPRAPHAIDAAVGPGGAAAPSGPGGRRKRGTTRCEQNEQGKTAHDFPPL